MADSMIINGQMAFLRRGGAYEMALMKMREKGLICEEGAYVHQEFPKALNIPGGSYGDQMVVATASEEDAVRAAFDRAPDLGIIVQPQWTAAVLLHAVSVAQRSAKASAPKPTPEEVKEARVAALKAELAGLEPAETANALAAAPKRRTAAAVSDLPVVAPDPAV